MRTRCERCEVVELTADGPASICSYECTFCEDCARTMDYTCRNCGGELVTRPRRLEQR
nr:DUF1272 domain-containing protein [Nocardia jejuensis]